MESTDRRRWNFSNDKKSKFLELNARKKYRVDKLVQKQHDIINLSLRGEQAGPQISLSQISTEPLIDRQYHAVLSKLQSLRRRYGPKNKNVNFYQN